MPITMALLDARATGERDGIYTIFCINDWNTPISFCLILNEALQEKD